MQIIGIDIGTTTISGAVLEYENEKTVKLLEAKTIENGGFMPTANEWEKIQDAGAIVKKAEKLLDDLLDKYPQTERIGLTGQMPSEARPRAPAGHRSDRRCTPVPSPS